MLKLRDLALRRDFDIGALSVSPSRRRVRGPAGETHLEPLIMQVLLILLDARDRVVTRDELFDRCWGGVTVGDDSLNRAIAKLRKIGSAVAPGLFEIETIPRTGYRMTGEIVGLHQQDAAHATSADADKRVSRRLVLAGGAAAIAGSAAAGLWLRGRRGDPRFDALIARGKEALRLDQPATEYFRQAAAIEPRDAGARGLLAFALLTASGDGPSDTTGATAVAVERAARAALDIDPKEPNALLSMLLVQADMMDWLTREKRFAQILEIDPKNTAALRSFGQFLHGVGRCGDSLLIGDRALAVEPLAPTAQAQRALRLWVLGRTADANQVLDRAADLWPSHRFVRLARLMVYAFTNRAAAALALVEDEAKQPILLTPAAAAIWRTSLVALDSRTPSAIAAAREANLQGARTAAAMAAWGILILSELRQLDAAFDVAEGFLLGRGSVVVRVRSDGGSPSIRGPGWRNTFGLFTPPAKAMRLDPRFSRLASGLGLTDYWHQRGIGPDGFLFRR